MDFWKRLSTAGLWCLSLALPVKSNRVVFSSFYGRGFSDNPKAIALELLKSNEKLDLIWLVKDEKEAASLPEGITPCPYDSPKRILALSTARVWVDNCRKYDRFKKKRQFYLQTWHGFPLKRIEKDALESLYDGYEQSAIKDSGHTDLLLSGSAFTTGVLRRCFWYDGEIAAYGSPRNDVIIRPDPHTGAYVREALHLPQDRKLALYAPTFRADHSVDAYKLDALALADACTRRFGGKWSVLIRLHPNIAAQSRDLFPYDGDRILDATMYPDMQELLCASDLLLTDYSSCMFDFALSKKPCFQFALDIEDYRKDRGFYFPLDQLPFPLADSNEALIQAIDHFDTDAYLERWEGFSMEKGFCEDGQAAHRCAQWILDRIHSEGDSVL